MKGFSCRAEDGFNNFQMNTGMFGGGRNYNFSVRDNISIIIKNTSGKAEEVDLMSRIQPTGVVVASDTIPIQGLITRLQANPMMFTSMKVIASNPTQLDNPILLTYKSALGAMEENSITPNAYKSSIQTQSNIVEIPDIQGVLDTDSSIVTVINPNSQLTLTLKVKQLFDNKRDFRNYLDFVQAKSRNFRNFMQVINI